MSTELFSHTVPEAHAKFLAACESAGVDVREVAHPLTGPDGEQLHSAVARLGPAKARRVLLTISGTHGIEGYFGSAMQVDALRRHKDLLPLDDDTAIVFVHLVNPWGTAWSSRENEDNVELLRGNYYCHRRKPPNHVFVDFHETMGYSRIGSIEELLATRSRAAEVAGRHGLEGLMRALADGQDTHPDAITYVGRGPTWSKRLLDEVVIDHVAGAGQALVLDLHTAVGPPGETVVMHSEGEGSPLDRLATSHLGPIWPNDEQLRYYDWVAELSPGTAVIGLVCEAGTEQLGPAEQYIFPLDVWIKCHGDRNDPAATPHLRRYRRFFYPETEEWMRSVHQHFVLRWAGALSMLAADWSPVT